MVLHPNLIVPVFMVISISLGSLIGCASFSEVAQTNGQIIKSSPLATQEYIQYIKANIALKDLKYSTQYEPIEFIVDTDFGSTKIQNLIDLADGRSIVEKEGWDRIQPQDKVEKAFQYIVTHYKYITEPCKWLSTRDIITQKQGDCKNLSLLLLSMLHAMGIDSYASISNNHMWVNATIANQWHIFELDQNPEHNRIYAIESFYEHPLYKIYLEQTLKRRVKGINN